MPEDIDVREAKERWRAQLTGKQIEDRVLYVIDVRVFNPFDLDHSFITRFDLTLLGQNHLAQEGPWTTTIVGNIFFGQMSGYWEAQDHLDAKRIWLSKFERTLFGTFPGTVGTIGDILRFPLFLGESGYGSICSIPTKTGNEDDPPEKAFPYYNVDWFVKQRMF